MKIKSLTLGLAGLSSAHAAMTCSGDAFQTILQSTGLSSNTTLVEVVPVSVGASWSATNPEFPQPPTDLPALCAVNFSVQSSSSSTFGFGIYLPDEWNSRMMTTGNGGFGGGINWPDMAVFSHYGFASVSTDTGHLSGSGNGTWALNNPEAVTDWGYRAMHETVILAKIIVSQYYASSIGKSYYAGCSTGGRQGLKEVEMFPADFDGVLAGAPAWWTTHLQTWTTYVGQQNSLEVTPDPITAAQYNAIVVEQVKQCDPQDGVTDQIISSPDTCDFDVTALLCQDSRSNKSACLQSVQLQTVQTMYSDYMNGSTFVFPGFEKGANPSALTLMPSTLGYGFLQNFVYNNSTWNWTSFSYADVEYADAVDPGMANANNFDLSGFESRGGKLIQYHGLADPLIPTNSSIYFREQVQYAMASSALDDWYRFFLIPDMGHCLGSANGAWYIGAANQPEAVGATYSVPSFADPQHDAVQALMNWVENGVAPDSIIATKYVNDTASDGVLRQRPLCPYPQKAYLRPGTIESVAANWQCL